MTFVCERCGTSCKTRQTLIVHLSRPNSCSSSITEIDRAELLNNIAKETSSFSCSCCNKSFTRKSYASIHEAKCKAVREKSIQTIPVVEDEPLQPAAIDQPMNTSIDNPETIQRLADLEAQLQQFQDKLRQKELQIETLLSLLHHTSVWARNCGPYQ